MWYFYILQSLQDKNCFYKGSSGNLNNRLQLHNAGKVYSTKARRPWRIVYFEAYVSKQATRLREKAVKHSGSISVPLLRRIKQSLKSD